MKEPILSREEVDAIWCEVSCQCRWLEGAHTKFAELLQTAILEKLCGEPRAWLVEGGRMFQDKPFLREANADNSIAERNDGARKTPLYALNQSKA